MAEPVSRFPDYDVLRKRRSMSWNEATRRVIDRRLAVDRTPHTLNAAEYATLEAICASVMPQADGAAFVPLAAYVDQVLTLGIGPGYTHADLPAAAAAWKRAIAALDAEAVRAFGTSFVEVDASRRDALLTRMQRGELTHPAWEGMPPALFFSQHILTDIIAAYYAHPTAWSQIGFGGPASPRGYVRMDFDERDPWESVEAKPGQERRAAKANRHVR